MNGRRFKLTFLLELTVPITADLRLENLGHSNHSANQMPIFCYWIRLFTFINNIECNVGQTV